MTTKPSAGGTAELRWLKSSYSSNEEPACVEVASTPATIRVRDSKNPEGPQLAFGPAEWSAFVSFAAEQV